MSWTTLSETDSFGFEVWARSREGDIWRLPGLTMATGSGSSYSVLDDSAEARAGRTAAYRIVELSFSGPGDASDWLPVESPAGRGGRTRTGSSEGRR